MPVQYRLTIPGALQLLSLDTGEPIEALSDKGQPMPFTGTFVARQLISQLQKDGYLDDFECGRLREKLCKEGPVILTQEEKDALSKVALDCQLPMIVRAAPDVLAFRSAILSAAVTGEPLHAVKA
jgi:hypothetical protein